MHRHKDRRCTYVCCSLSYVVLLCRPLLGAQRWLAAFYIVTVDVRCKLLHVPHHKRVPYIWLQMVLDLVCRVGERKVAYGPASKGLRFRLVNSDFFSIFHTLLLAFVTERLLQLVFVHRQVCPALLCS